MRRLVSLRIALVALLVGLLIAAGTDAASAEPGFAPIHQLAAPIGDSPSEIFYGSLSCAGADWCAAAGYGNNGKGAPFVATESSGIWASPQKISLPTSGSLGGTLSLACPSPGNCVAAGAYETGFGKIPILATEDSGVWSAASTFALPPNAVSGSSELLVDAPWCQSLGNCIVIGIYQGGPLGFSVFSKTESSGTWGAASSLPVGEGSPYGAIFSCTSVGNCLVIAGFSSWVESSGTWGAPASFIPTPPTETFHYAGMACPDTTTCIVVGFVQNNRRADAQPRAASLTDESGTWGQVEALPLPQLSPRVIASEFWQISCASGQCVAVGDAGSFDGTKPFHSPAAATWEGGSWSSIGLEPMSVTKGDRDDSYLDDVSCTATTSCTSVGDYGVYNPGHGASGSVAPFVTELLPVRAIVRPGPPVDPVARPHLGGASVSWQPPIDDGGSPIAGYTVRVEPGTASCMTSATSCRIGGLINGRQYVATVTDSNGSSASSPRAFSRHFFAGAVPSLPAHLHFVLTSRGVTVQWRRSTSPPGEPVLRYTVDARGRRTVARCISRRPSCTYRSLRAGRYEFAVTASDATGTSKSVRVSVSFG